MNQFESMADALRVANEVLAGTIDPNLGCGLIAQISHKLNHPPELQFLSLLGHDQVGHEHLGIAASSCVPEIIKACRSLVAESSQLNGRRSSK